jgi:methyltransferase-like protein
LKAEQETIRGHEDGYFYHDHLEEVNLPIYFHQFVSRAEAHGLQYLSDADISSMWIGSAAPEVTSTLRNMAKTPVELEQYIDFLRNRMFRHSLLCHRAAAAHRQLSPARLGGLYVAAPMFAADPQNAIAAGGSSLPFRHAVSGATFETVNPIQKAAMLALGRHWPACLGFDHLFDVACREASIPSTISAETLAAEKSLLAAALLQCYVASLVELRTHPTNLRARPGDLSRVSPLARWQAANSPSVTTLRHERVQLDGFCRRVLQLLDGTRNRADIQRELSQTRPTGDEHTLGKSSDDSGAALPVSAHAVDDALRTLASAGLLLAGE